MIKVLRVMLCLGALCLLAVGCATNRAASVSPSPETELAARPGWTLAPSGDNL